ncbi:type II toxin-antitoxin system RelE/ParE family toxin [Spirosoma montaniterrae]|uniref:Addiction module toxin RelE n=1 Tax=Spirosoma montaniterrae TaxID=1178516 RepID=A0A1P9WWK4_9BACT|nr:type II toxin-antitoxin system RelE/ParE family toxin [Spirosoma montaniterrae]AQG79765.1 hypothetical protein AWR27_10775 [Spirosoma montaniterrae]
MNYSILSTEKFDKLLKRLARKHPSIKSDLTALLTSLQTDPTQGASLGRNCYKVRLAIKSKAKGKSGGARVITHLHISETTVILLTIYDKAEKEDLTPNELEELLAALAL